jgi:hypothetical protein
MRVLQAFLAPGANSTGPASPGASPFVFNIAPMIGGESAQPIRPAPAPQSPLANDADQFAQAYARINQIVSQISGGADLSHRWTPDRVTTALQGLESLRAQSGVTDEQYQALKAALQSMLTG